MSENRMSSKNFFTKRMGVALLVGLVCVSGAVAYNKAALKNLFSTKAANPVTATSDLVVVAVVNGNPVYEVEITAGGLTNAVSRAQLVDEYVNKVLMASDMEETSMTPELATRLAGARREILAEGWMNQQYAKIKSSITDADMKKSYETEITDAMFSRYKLSFIMGATSAEASKRTDWDTLKGGEADWFSLQAIPYQMGTMIATMKAGDITQTPIAVREGFLRVRLDEIKSGQKPAFNEMKPKITEVLIIRKQQLSLQTLREKGDIRIK